MKRQGPSLTFRPKLEATNSERVFAMELRNIYAPHGIYGLLYDVALLAVYRPNSLRLKKVVLTFFMTLFLHGSLLVLST